MEVLEADKNHARLMTLDTLIKRGSCHFHRTSSMPSYFRTSLHFENTFVLNDTLLSLQCFHQISRPNSLNFFNLELLVKAKFVFSFLPV